MGKRLLAALIVCSAVVTMQARALGSEGTGYSALHRMVDRLVVDDTDVLTMGKFLPPSAKCDVQELEYYAGEAADGGQVLQELAQLSDVMVLTKDRSRVDSMFRQRCAYVSHQFDNYIGAADSYMTTAPSPAARELAGRVRGDFRKAQELIERLGQ